MLVKKDSVCVLGLGKSGLAAIDYLLQQGKDVYAYDDKLKQELACFLEGKGVILLEKAQLPSCEELVVSPGVSPKHPLYMQALEASIPVIGEVELALRDCVNPLVGITGTNGKTTVTMMVTHCLNACGISARALGNVGEPMTKALPKDPKTVLVLELSSYQLETLSAKKLHAAVILNVSEDHLERHGSLDGIFYAKRRIAKCLKKGMPFFVHSSLVEKWGKELPEEAQVYDKLKENIDYIFPVGYRVPQGHDYTNFFAAYVLCREFGVHFSNFCKAAETFTKPPHRLEKVRSVEGVNYINDSKATNIDAVEQAIRTLDGPIHLIAGGYDKGLSYEHWLEVFEGKVKQVCAVGQTAPQLVKDLGPTVDVHEFSDLESAIRHCQAQAVEGDQVLFSPGSSSFDLYKNYEHRGDVFRDLVKSLS